MFGPARVGGLRVLLSLLFLLLTGDESRPRPPMASHAIRGGWLAPHGGQDLLSSAATDTLKRLRALGVEWLAVGPEATLAAIDRPELSFGEDDENLRAFLRRARELEFQILLLPRIESPAFFAPPYPFRADIGMNSPEDWRRFHANYRRMMLHYARLSQEEGVSILSLGLEYKRSSLSFPSFWRELASATRKVFHGKLCYSANWWQEYEDIEFWKDLDFIGIGAYFQVDHRDPPRPGHYRDGLSKVALGLGAFSRRHDRPILFTEVGYTAFADVARWPWKWQDQARPVDPCQQALCYEALFSAFGNESWFAGTFLWSFYTSREYVKPWEYSPLNRPAESVIRAWYARPGR